LETRAIRKSKSGATKFRSRPEPAPDLDTGWKDFQRPSFTTWRDPGERVAVEGQIAVILLSINPGDLVFEAHLVSSRKEQRVVERLFMVMFNSPFLALVIPLGTE
jgi:hypothetical protein